MELHPNASVLPSNAPALLEDARNPLSTSTDAAETPSTEICQNYNRGNSCSACSLQHVCLRCKQHGHPAADCERGVLRVSSGNAGSSIFHSRNPNLKTWDTQEYEIRCVSSLVNPPHHSAQAAIKAEHPRRQQHSSWSSLKGPPWYWRVEFETPRYCAYREKCKQKGSKDDKWPDRVEEAFQLAIRVYPRRGRRKLELNGKQAGGNEFISEFIYQVTGQKRDRKKVSSHIQVLKNFLRENKAWMSLVAAIPPDSSTKKKSHSGTIQEEAGGAHETLEYDDTSCYPFLQAPFAPLPSPVSAPIEILASNLYQGPTLRRVSEFAITLAMNLEDKRGSKAVRHTCTSIQSETPSAPKALASVVNWRQMYPALATYNDQEPIDCPMFLFDAHLSLIEHNYPSNLGIHFSMDFSQGAHYTEWRSYLKIYEHNGCPVDQLECHLESVHLKGTDNCRLVNVPLKAKWWVRVLSDMFNRKGRAEDDGDPKLIREEEERAIQYVRGISVMQEIRATHGASNHGPQRMAILLWRFDTARRGEAATTSWRKLVPPLSAYHVQSPYPPPENPPMTLDTALQAASPYVSQEDSQPSIFSGCPGGGLLTAPLSEDSSSSTTPMPESRSFPSSASASFPSSASNLAYPLYSSQESSFHSQDSVYPPLGIFDSQDPGYTLYEHHEVVEASQESYRSHESVNCSRESYASQEVMYHSQESLYPDALDQLCEYPCQIVDLPDTASASQDFTGGQIQLSYAQTEDPQSPFETPLIAPQANMVPQHQLIQHPEHFDQHDYLEPNPDDVNGCHDGLDEQAQAQPIEQSYELNGLTIDYSGWEETLRLNPDLERHFSINTLDEVGAIEEQNMSPVGEGDAEQRRGEVLGEVQDEEGSPKTLLESPLLRRGQV